MATVSEQDIPIGSGWIDIVNDSSVGNSAIANRNVKLQNKAAQGETVHVAFGGAEAPESPIAGDILPTRGDWVTGKAGNIWVRSSSTQIGQDYVGVARLEA